MVRQGLWIAIAVTLWSTSAAGQVLDCAREDPGICEITPTPPPRLGECAVEPIPRNAPIKLRLTDGFLEAVGIEGVLVSVSRADTGVQVAGRLTDAGHDTVFFVPEEPWQAGGQYDVLLRAGLDEVDLCFRASEAFDTEPPRLGRILSVMPRPDTVAADMEPGALRVDVEFEAATDDGPLGSIEYFLYLTRGEGLVGPMLLWRGRHQTEVVVAGVALPAEQAVAPACIAVVAVDGVGHTDATAPACFEPLQGNYFEPLCTAVPGAWGRDLASTVGFWLLAVTLARRRGWRGRPRGEA